MRVTPKYIDRALAAHSGVCSNISRVDSDDSQSQSKFIFSFFFCVVFFAQSLWCVVWYARVWLYFVLSRAVELSYRLNSAEYTDVLYWCAFASERANHTQTHTDSRPDWYKHWLPCGMHGLPDKSWNIRIVHIQCVERGEAAFIFRLDSNETETSVYLCIYTAQHFMCRRHQFGMLDECRVTDSDCDTLWMSGKTITTWVRATLRPHAQNDWIYLQFGIQRRVLRTGTHMKEIFFQPHS